MIPLGAPGVGSHMCENLFAGDMAAYSPAPRSHMCENVFTEGIVLGFLKGHLIDEYSLSLGSLMLEKLQWMLLLELLPSC